MEPVKGGMLAQVPPKAETASPLERRPNWSHPFLISGASLFAASPENVMMVLSGMSTMAQLLDNTGLYARSNPFPRKSGDGPAGEGYHQ